MLLKNHKKQVSMTKLTTLKFISLLWLGSLSTVNANVVATGNYPDIATDREGNVHLVYGRDQRLYYRLYNAAQSEWSAEETTPVIRSDKSWDLHRADPDIVVDRQGRPHVHAWDGYAYRNQGQWISIPLLPNTTRYRDSELAIDSLDTVYLTRRGGFNGGHLGIQKREAGSSVFVPVTDADRGLTRQEISNHIYADLAVSPVDDSLHVIQRHGPGRTTAYRRSRDRGATWDLCNTVSDLEPEAPHIAVNFKGEVYATHGGGEFFRLEQEAWVSEGYPVRCRHRDQPELTTDDQGHVYLATFGGRFNVRRFGRWVGEKHLLSVTGAPIGFVETSGTEDGAYAVWEENETVSNDTLAASPAQIVVGRMSPQGDVGWLQPNAMTEAKPGSRIDRFGLFETAIPNGKSYADPYGDVSLRVTLRDPRGRVVQLEGFYDGAQTWRFRFRPEYAGPHTYEARFTDGTPGRGGTFRVGGGMAHTAPIGIDPHRPMWFRRGAAPFQIRAFHAGDRFFARNWPADKRQAFLDWFQQQGYNTLSVASHYLNRREADRGQGWDTPDLWPLNPTAYAHMEGILDELQRRGIVVFPFAGFIGKNSNYPRTAREQERYIRYTLARIGHYGNILYNVAGPEPNLKDGWLPAADVTRLGRLIRDLDAYRHPLTVHNRTGDDPYRDSDWTRFGTLQGPKTVDRRKLSQGLLESHHPAKPLFAQETLWSGNMYHVKKRLGRDYSDDDIRKNAYVIKMSGASFCFADNNGNSSSGFSGSLDLRDRTQHRHDIIKQVWDFFDSIPYYEMRPHQDLVDSGYCLALPGQGYLVYLEAGGTVKPKITGGPYQITWINGRKTADRREGGMLTVPKTLQSPTQGDDWLLLLETPATRS